MKTAISNNNEPIMETEIVDSRGSVVWRSMITEAIGWNVDGDFRPLMVDVMQNLISEGAEIDAETIEATNDARREANARFFAAYTAEQPAEPSDEELFEMRAAFGTGKTIVDVISGRKIQL